MNSHVNFFISYGESKSGVLFNDEITARVVGTTVADDADRVDATDTSTEITELMIGWQFMY